MPGVSRSNRAQPIRSLRALQLFTPVCTEVVTNTSPNPPTKRKPVGILAALKQFQSL
jgi:hypothetical protein